MRALFRKTGVLMIDGLLKEAADYPTDQWRSQTRYMPPPPNLNEQPGIGRGVIDQIMQASNPEYYEGLEPARDDNLSGLGSTAAERAPKVVSVAK